MRKKIKVGKSEANISINLNFYKTRETVRLTCVVVWSKLAFIAFLKQRNNGFKNKNTFGNVGGNLIKRTSCNFGVSMASFPWSVDIVGHLLKFEEQDVPI